MRSQSYLEFLGAVWDNLPEDDKLRLVELWTAYEQCTSSVYQKFFEDRLNVAIADVQPYSTERWLPFTFDKDNRVDRAAVWSSTQDLSQNIDLSKKYLIKLSVDGRPPVTVDVRGDSPGDTRIGEIVSKINQRMSYTLARTILGGAVVQLVSPTAGLSSSIEILETDDPALNASELVLGLSSEELPRRVPDYPYIFSTAYPQMASVPELQDRIGGSEVQVSLLEGPDYKVDTKSTLLFKAAPPATMWAPRVLMNQENPWANFGFLMDLYQPNSQRYADVLQGLWYAYWTGPKPGNLKRSLFLLFGLPTAKEICTVSAVSPTSISTVSDTGISRTFAVPRGLAPVVSIGDRLDRYAPLVDGIEVLDKANTPGFMTDIIGRTGLSRFMTESASRGEGDTDETRALRLLEEYTFLPQIDVNAFISPDISIGAVKNFLDAIKPANKTYWFQVVTANFKDDVLLNDSYSWSLDMDLSGTLDANDTTYSDQTELADHELSASASFCVDPNGVCLQEDVQCEVRSFGALIDAFSA